MTTQRKTKKLPFPVFLLLALGISLCARASIAAHYVVPTGSMEPSVHSGDHLIVNKMAYGIRIPCSHVYLSRYSNPSAGDVVVLDSPENDKVLLKRIVAVEGDTIEIKQGRILRNNRLAPISNEKGETIENLNNRKHKIDLSNGGGTDMPRVKIPNGKVLVMGDNRGNSFDGRHFGIVDKDAILGKALGIFFSQELPVWKRL